MWEFLIPVFYEECKISYTVINLSSLEFQVKEAEKILRKQLVQVTDMMRHIYNDRVLVATATVEQLEELSRSSRSILQSEVGLPSCIKVINISK